MNCLKSNISECSTFSGPGMSLESQDRNCLDSDARYWWRTRTTSSLTGPCNDLGLLDCYRFGGSLEIQPDSFLLYHLSVHLWISCPFFPNTHHYNFPLDLNLTLEKKDEGITNKCSTIRTKEKNHTKPFASSSSLLLPGGGDFYFNISLAGQHPN